MANPQLEYGFLRIANEVWDALTRTRISGEARQVLDLIIRKTDGFNKESDTISLSQFSGATGLSKPHVQRALRKLISMNVVIKQGYPKKGKGVSQKGYTKSVTYSFNKDYDTWRGVPKKGYGVSQKGKKGYPKKGHTKDINTKDNMLSSREKRDQKPDPNHKQFVTHWCNQYRDRFGIDYNFQGGKDGALVERILKVCPLDEAKQLAAEFFQSDDKFVREAGCSIGVFHSQLGKLREQHARNCQTAERGHWEDGHFVYDTPPK